MVPGVGGGKPLRVRLGPWRSRLGPCGLEPRGPGDLEGEAGALGWDGTFISLFVCFFVCFVCLFVCCLFVCLIVCLIVCFLVYSFVFIVRSFLCSFFPYFVCSFVCSFVWTDGNFPLCSIGHPPLQVRCPKSRPT